MTSLRRVAVVIAVVAFVAANAVNALTKGGDFTVYLDAGARFLHGSPLYSDSGVGGGVIGPPFQALAFVPFALVAEVSTVAARVAWYATNLLLLGCGIVWWSRAMSPALGVAITRRGLPVEFHRLVLPVLAVAFPVQTNFEHQNLNAALLAITGASVVAVAGGRAVRAGVLTGVAAALKAFPALLILPIFCGGLYAGVVVAAAVAAGATLAATVRYGIAATPDVLHAWMNLSAGGGWPLRGNNQSLFAMLARYFGPEGLTARDPLPLELHPTLYVAWAASAVGLVAVATWLAWRWRSTALTPVAMAVALAVAVLVSPIAWDHYWVLLFPVFFAVWNVPAAPRWSRVVFFTAAVFTSGFVRVTVGASGLSLARELSLLTWAGLLLVASLAALGSRPGAVGGTRRGRPIRYDRHG